MSETRIKCRDKMKKEITFAQAIQAAQKFKSSGKRPVFWETAWKKAAAASETAWPQEIISHKGTYKIEIMQSEEDQTRGMIVISILKDKELIEGKIISISDGNGRKLLESKVKDGYAYNADIDLRNINLRLLVNTVD